MVSAIGSAFGSTRVSDPAATAAGIEAQIARYKKELSDCVNCESAKTTGGKAEIAAIASKISTAEARIEKINTDKQSSEPAASATTTDLTTRANVGAGALNPDNTQASSQPAPLKSFDLTRGGRIDLYA